jgi:hypothetical protein
LVLWSLGILFRVLLAFHSLHIKTTQFASFELRGRGNDIGILTLFLILIIIFHAPKTNYTLLFRRGISRVHCGDETRSL